MALQVKISTLQPSEFDRANAIELINTTNMKNDVPTSALTSWVSGEDYLSTSMMMPYRIPEIYINNKGASKEMVDCAIRVRLFPRGPVFNVRDVHVALMQHEKNTERYVTCTLVFALFLRIYIIHCMPPLQDESEELGKSKFTYHRYKQGQKRILCAMDNSSGSFGYGSKRCINL